MKLQNPACGIRDLHPLRRPWCQCGLAFLLLCCLSFVVWTPFGATSYEYPAIPFMQRLSGPRGVSIEQIHCQNSSKPHGTESLPRGIISPSSDLERLELSDGSRGKGSAGVSKNLLAIPAGIKQKEMVDKIVRKFLANNFTIMLFHYDGVVDQWRDLNWSDQAIHISVVNQTKWWFAKRFLHPDIVVDYDYVFLWDEDLDLDNFHPDRYVSIIKEEGLEISQPALDPYKSEVHHQITVRSRRARVHRRIYKFAGGVRCLENSTGPPCTGWVEMMAPVFSRASWRCVWHMIQNDLIHAWGLDMKLGYCAMGDRTQKVGVVDAEYIVHKGIPSLGDDGENHISHETAKFIRGPRSPHKSCSSNRRCNIRRRSYNELNIFKRRWQSAVDEDKCWIDPFAETTIKESKQR